MLTFTGEDPNAWINRAERFFKAGRYSEVEKVEVTTLNLDGENVIMVSGHERFRGYMGLGTNETNDLLAI